MAKNKKSGAKKLSGLEGWLILPILGLFVNLAMMIYDFILLFSLIGEYYMEIFFFLDGGMIYLYVFALILIFKKNKKAPKWAIYTLWAGVVYGLITSYILADYTGVMGSVAGALIWTFYFKNSERVKNTFVKK